MGSDGVGAVEGLDGLGADADVQSPPAVAGRDRVETATNSDPALAVDAVAGHHRHVEHLGRQAPECVDLESEVLADGDPPVVDVPPVIACSAGLEEQVELNHRRHPWDRDQMTAAEPADLALHTALLVAALDARLADEAVEAVVGPHRHEPVRLDPAAPLT